MLVKFESMQTSVKQFISENATVLLTGTGVVGTVATGVLAWRGGYKTSTAHREAEVKKIQAYAATQDPSRKLDKETLQELLDNSESLTTQEKVVMAIPSTAPAVLTGVGTISAIIFSHRMSAQKAAAMAALYGLSQDRFEEYRNKVQEKLTGPKAQAIDDEVAQEHIDKHPPGNNLVVIEGKVLCYDDATGRYFKSTMEDLRRAENVANQQIFNSDTISASEFYDLIGLPPNVWSDDVGWNMDNPVALKFSTTLTDSQEPCIHMSFANVPKSDYYRRNY